MKKLINLTLVITTAFFTACSPQQNETPKTYLSGKYSPANDSVKIYLSLASKEIDYDYPIYLDSTLTNDSGEFMMELAITEPLEVAIKNDYEYQLIYLEPGDSIYYESDNNYRTIITEATGKGADKLLLLSRVDTLFSFLNMREYDSAEMDLQFRQRDQVYEQLLSAAKTTYSPAFNDYLEATYLQSKHYYVTSFHRYMQMYDMKLPLDTAAQEQLNEKLIAFSKKEVDHANFNRSIYTHLLRQIYHDSLDWSQRISTYQQAAYGLELSDSLTNQLLAQGYLMFLKRGQIKEVEPYINEYKNKLPNTLYTQTLTTEFEEWKALSVGEFAPQFNALYADSTNFKLSDLNGKVVYIDIWATWCKPCLEEMPYAEDIHKEFENEEDIAFLNVSVDNSWINWSNYLDKHSEPDVIDVLTPGNFNSDIATAYKVQGIPRYMIIDREGKIFSIDAQRPSSGDKLIDQLNEALGMPVQKM